MTYRYRVAIVFLAGFFIDCINIFMSAIALPNIANQLQVSESSTAWVANAYILGLILIIPLSAWIASLWGARITMVISMLIFSVGALCSGLSNDFSWLVIFRFIQGVGGGLLIPIGQALTFGLFGKQERAKISTLVMAVALIAPAVSPAIGGVLVDYFSWRWVFLSNMPLGLATALLAFYWIKNNRTKQESRPDIVGLLWVSLALTAILLGMSFYAATGSLLLFLWLVLLGAIFSCLYIRHYRLVSTPILDISLLANLRMQFSIITYYAVPGVFTGVNLLAIFFFNRYWAGGLVKPEC